MFLTLLAVLVLLPLLTGCDRFIKDNPPLVFCSPDAPRMRRAVQGLEAALGQGPLEAVFVSVSGEGAETELRRLRQRRPRLLLVLGTAALMQAAPVEKRIPMVFGVVANPYFTGAAWDPKDPWFHLENATGIASPAPLAAALNQGAALLGKGPWGLLYDPNDGVAVEIKERFLKEAPDAGIQPLIEASASAGEDRSGLELLLTRGAKVIYLPPAPGAARYADLLLAWGRELKVKVVSGHPEILHKGALLRVTLDYYRLGEEIGALARRVLQGEKPAQIPIIESTPIKVEVDESLLRQWMGYPATGGAY